MSDNGVDKIKRDIERARKFAEKRFNAYIDEQTTPSHMLAPVTWCIEYPDVDKMIVIAMSYGKRMDISEVKYRLAWIDDNVMVWIGKMSLTGMPAQLTVV